MKKVLFFLLFVLLVSASANPIATPFFSELYFDSTGWKIEINPYHSNYQFALKSLTDSAVVDTPLSFISDYPVITPGDIGYKLNINANGDHLKIGFLESGVVYWVDEFTFGDSGVVAAPLSGQSICHGQFHHIDMSFPTYFLDNTPTIGYTNDNEGAQGCGKGLVIDPYGIPIPNVKICTPFPESETGWPFFSVLTDSLGRFEFNTISFKWQIIINKDGYYSQLPQVQIWPDSTIELNIVLKPKPEYYQSYFPLQVGNVWKYYGTYNHDSSSVSVTGVTNIEDKQYYILGGSYVRYDSLGNLLLYRNGKDTIEYHLSLGGQDSVIFPLEYDTLIIYSYRNLTHRTIPIGNISDIITLWYHIKNTCDGDRWVSFARNVGLIEDGLDGPVCAVRFLYYAKVNGVEYPTSGIEPEESTQAEKYALKLENYPNPFNFSTTLKYHLTETGDVQLSVFDLSGRLVEELFSGRQPAGDYHYLWSGGNLPSGVYFLSLQAGDQKIVQKCLLMK